MAHRNAKTLTQDEHYQRYLNARPQVALPAKLKCSSCEKTKATAVNFSSGQQDRLRRLISEKGQQAALAKAREGKVMMCVVCAPVKTEKRCEDCEKVLGFEKFNKTQRKLDDGRCDECMRARLDKKPTKPGAKQTTTAEGQEVEGNDDDTASEFSASSGTETIISRTESLSFPENAAPYKETSTSSENSEDWGLPGGGVAVNVESWLKSETGRGPTSARQSDNGTVDSSAKSISGNSSTGIATGAATHGSHSRGTPSVVGSVQSSADTETGSRAHFDIYNAASRWPKIGNANSAEVVAQQAGGDDWVDESYSAKGGSDNEDDDDNDYDSDEDCEYTPCN